MQMKKKIQLIAGPCSAESRKQLIDTAALLEAGTVDYFRAGLWKPRTHPGCFEGVGEEGLPWLVEVRERFGMKVCTEVASPKHIEACLNADIDLMWIGARTTANPFMVEEIAQALAGTGKAVMVKNPVNQDAELWCGAIERLQRHGIEKIGIIHRGFSSFKDLKYRNDPRWQTAIEVRSAFPDLPFLCDPSHMSGDVRYIPEISQKAMDLGFDGLMVEVHNSPADAKSDNSQQLTPQEFQSLVDGLRVRENSTEDVLYNEALEQLRSEIDSIDGEIISALSRRMAVSREIGLRKKNSNIAIIQPSRWDEVISDVYAKGRECGLSDDMLYKIFSAIHEASVSEQNKINEK